MVRAVWNGAVLAESGETELVEGNHYFPPQSINREYFSDSSLTTVCPWKGVASYYAITVAGAVNPDAAWHYPEPSSMAHNIQDHVAFWNGVQIEDGTGTPRS